MLTKVVRYGVTLHDLRNNFGRKRNIVIHHGLMGSCKNFRTISKSKAFSDYFNSYMIDARNHGKYIFMKVIVHTQQVIRSRS